MCKTVTLIAIFNHIMIQTYVEAQVIGEIEIDFILLPFITSLYGPAVLQLLRPHCSSN